MEPDELRLFSRDNSLVIAVQCAREGCTDAAETELDRQQLTRQLARVREKLTETDGDAPSPTGGLKEWAGERVAKVMVPRILQQVEERLDEGLDLTLPVPWSLGPSIFCDGDSMEQLRAVDADVSAWWDHRERSDP